MAEERLRVDGGDEDPFLVSHHVQRYELAAKLCDGVRVADVCCGTGYGSAILARHATSVVGIDNDPGTIDEARRRFAQPRFEVADAVEWLAAPAAREVQAIVMLEGLEHLADPEAAVARLSELAHAGTRIVISVPNNRTFREDNEFHVTDYDEQAALDLAGSLPDAVVLRQFFAEGSVIVGPGSDPGPMDTSLHHLERAEEEYANHFVIVSHVDAADGSSPLARMLVSVAPTYNRQVLGLENANRALWEANQRLVKGYWGTHDSAAASLLKRAETAEKHAAELKEQLVIEKEVAREHHENYQRVIEWYDAPRYRLVDRVRNKVLELPGLRGIAETSWRQLTVRRRD